MFVQGLERRYVMSEPSAKAQEEALALVKSLVTSSVREAIGDLADRLRDDLRDDLSRQVEDRLQRAERNSHPRLSQVRPPPRVPILVCQDLFRQARARQRSVAVPSWLARVCPRWEAAASPHRGTARSQQASLSAALTLSQLGVH